MDLFRRISGSSTSSTDENTFRRSRSFSGLRRRSSKDSSKGVRSKKAVKETLRDYHASQQAYPSAPQSPYLGKSSGPDGLDIINEDLLTPRHNISARPASERMYSHDNDSFVGSDNGDSIVTALSPRRDSTIAVAGSLSFNIPRPTNSRRISEHIDPLCNPNLNSVSRAMSFRKKSEAVKIYEDDTGYFTDRSNSIINTVQQTQVEKIERTVPQVPVLPDVPESYSTSSSYSDRLGNRASIVSFVTTNSSAPSPTAPITGLGSRSRKTVDPYIPDDESLSYELLPPGQPPASDRERLGSARVIELSQKLMSKDHMRVIVSDPKFLSEFFQFIEVHRPPASMALLTYYLDAKKAIKAIKYANAIAAALGPSPLPDKSWIQLDDEGISPVNQALEKKAADAFKALVEQELPRYVSWVYSEIVTLNIHRKIAGQEVKYMGGTQHELAEVFCLTDPKRTDNPIIFASEEFHKTTQYPISYVAGRNCRFLQGPKSSKHAISRFRDSVIQGKQHTECFLNYKRDGTPFVNLCMSAPLCDAKGDVRYFIGAQIDVTALVKSHTGLDSFKKLMSKQRKHSEVVDAGRLDLDFAGPKNTEFNELCELFSSDEIDRVQKRGGRLHRDNKARNASDSSDVPDVDEESNYGDFVPPIELLSPPDEADESMNSKFASQRPGPPKKTSNSWARSFQGVYRHYILVRPSPSLRILFASPSMRTPGILQSPLMSKIGGSDEVRDELHDALTSARGITVKVRWLSKMDEMNPKYAGRERWLHCTPLFGANGAVGVWMIVIVDDDLNSDAMNDDEEAEYSSGLGVDIRPGSGSSKSYRLSADVSVLNGLGGRRRDAPIIKEVEEWRTEHALQHPDLVPF